MFMNQRAAIQSVLLNNTSALVYTSPANTVARLSSVTFTNQSNNAVTVTVNLVKSGSAAGDENRVINQYVIGPRESWTSPHLNHNLNPGDGMYAHADVQDVVSVYGSVIEMSRA